MEHFPRTTVGGMSLPRMLIGTNWMLGWSHTGAAADAAIREKFASPADFWPVLSVFLEAGVDAIMAPLSTTPIAAAAVDYAEQKAGSKIIRIDTPALNVNDSESARREAAAAVKHSREIGSDFCLIHHTSVEQLVNKNLCAIPRLPDYLAMIRDEGLLPGLSAHMPEVVQYADSNGYDVETYIQIFNCMGFLMQVEVENVARIIWNAKHPVMTIKPMAAGRTTPYIGLTFSWNAIRECDMVTVGTNSPREAAEDIEISVSALEHRFPDLEARSSPFRQTVLGH
ncbi:MAG: hypothetical protein E7576_08780 [Ruminococcaceae bacterium]|jgi:hypothetical protein|nr:hypothetical protein [Oscillospiraceae bacterium]